MNFLGDFHIYFETGELIRKIALSKYRNAIDFIAGYDGMKKPIR